MVGAQEGNDGHARLLLLSPPLPAGFVDRLIHGGPAQLALAGTDQDDGDPRRFANHAIHLGNHPLEAWPLLIGEPLDQVQDADRDQRPVFHRPFGCGQGGGVEALVVSPHLQLIPGPQLAAKRRVQQLPRHLQRALGPPLHDPGIFQNQQESPRPAFHRGARLRPLEGQQAQGQRPCHPTPRPHPKPRGAGTCEPASPCHARNIKPGEHPETSKNRTPETRASHSRPMVLTASGSNQGILAARFARPAGTWVGQVLRKGFSAEQFVAVVDAVQANGWLPILSKSSSRI